jgi:uncharacterized protein (DUF433 family)
MDMTLTSSQPVTILRTERGLTIVGTRTSLYDVMDLLKAQYPPQLIRDTFNLTDAQIHSALAYIAANATEVEAEYQAVLRTRVEIAQYWEVRNGDRLARIAAAPRKPEHAAIWAKLEAQKVNRSAMQQSLR